MFAQGSLLYVGARIIPIRSPLGGRIYDVQHHFQYASNLHNYVPYLTLPPIVVFGWIELTVDGTHYADTDANAGKHIYDAFDVASLFQPA